MVEKIICNNKDYIYNEIIINKLSVVKAFEKRSDLSNYRQNYKKTYRLRNNIKNIKTIRSRIIDLELYRTKAIEDIQSEVMDAINCINDIENEINNLNHDVEVLKEDLKVGTLTIEDRLFLFKYELELYLSKFQEIKNKFYTNKNISI